jgi:hypothetical protein
MQVCFYLAASKMKITYGATITLFMVLIGNFFVFPRFFFPEPEPNGICLMSVLGITVAFWVFGGGAAVFIHLVYRYWSKI